MLRLMIALLLAMTYTDYAGLQPDFVAGWIMDFGEMTVLIAISLIISFLLMPTLLFELGYGGKRSAWF